jgi:radical SAM-linked protein
MFVTRYAGRENTGGLEKTLRIRFTKLGQARYLSHLELSTALSRALSLSGISFVFSQGYHPHPKISFAGATSVGMESRGEFVDIRIQDPREALVPLTTRINAVLPAGLSITAICELPPRTFSLAELVVGFAYELILPGNEDDEELDRFEAKIRTFLQAETFGVTRETNGKSVIKEIRPFVTGLTLDRAGRRIHLSARFGPEGTVRPAEVLTGVLGISSKAVHKIRIMKSGTLLADFADRADQQIFFQERL